MKGRINRCEPSSGNRIDVFHSLLGRASLGFVLLGVSVGVAQGQAVVTGHSPVNCGRVTIGSTATLESFTLTPDAPIVLDDIALSGPDSGDFAASATCVTGDISGTTIEAGQACQVRVAFTPRFVGGRTAILTVTSHSVGDQTPHVDAVGLIGSGIARNPIRQTVTLPFVAVAEGAPTITPVGETTVNTVTNTPTVTATRGSLTRLAEEGTLIRSSGDETIGSATIATAAGIRTHLFVGTFVLPQRYVFGGIPVSGRDSLTLSSAGTATLDPEGRPILINDGVFYVVKGTGRFTGATGVGTVVTTIDRGVVTEKFNGAITMVVPNFIYLSDLFDSWNN